LLLCAALALLRGRLERVGSRIAGAPAWALFLLPIVYLAATRQLLLPMFEVTHALVDDWYNHAVSFAAFLFGFLVVKDGRVTAQFIRMRRAALASFLVSYAAFAGYAWAYRAGDAVPPELLRSIMRLVYAVDQWSAIVAVIGFGALHLGRDSPMLRTLTVAVFPFYIAHQTIIVVVGHHLKPLHLPVAAEATLLLAATAAGCWATFEIARRFDWLRPLFGLGPRRRDSAPGPESLAPA
jgi:glucans biosynthesis protein C